MSRIGMFVHVFLGCLILHEFLDIFCDIQISKLYYAYKSIFWLFLVLNIYFTIFGKTYFKKPYLMKSEFKFIYLYLM